MWKVVALSCLMLVLALWFYRPAGSRVNLGPGGGSFVVAKKFYKTYTGRATITPEHNERPYGDGYNDPKLRDRATRLSYRLCWVALEYRLPGGSFMDWGLVEVDPREWDGLEVGDGYGGDVLRKFVPPLKEFIVYTR